MVTQDFIVPMQELVNIIINDSSYNFVNKGYLIKVIESGEVTNYFFHPFTGDIFEYPNEW